MRRWQSARLWCGLAPKVVYSRPQRRAPTAQTDRLLRLVERQIMTLRATLAIGAPMVWTRTEGSVHPSVPNVARAYSPHSGRVGIGADARVESTCGQRAACR